MTHGPEKNHNQIKTKKTIKTYEATAVRKQDKPKDIKIYTVYTVFIGGAADKDKYLYQGPTNIVYWQAQYHYSKTKKPSAYIDYSEIDKIIPDLSKKYNNSGKSLKINIVGHSLGGRQAAILSGRLYQKYKIKTNLLITLDPVIGPEQGKLEIKLANNKGELIRQFPEPVAKKWINIRADYTLSQKAGYEILLSQGVLVPKKRPTIGDSVAIIGNRWIPKELNMARRPDYDYQAPFHHEEVSELLRFHPSGYKINFSAWSELLNE